MDFLEKYFAWIWVIGVLVILGIGGFVSWMIWKTFEKFVL